MNRLPASDVLNWVKFSEFRPRSETRSEQTLVAASKEGIPPATIKVAIWNRAINHRKTTMGTSVLLILRRQSAVARAGEAPAHPVRFPAMPWGPATERLAIACRR